MVTIKEQTRTLMELLKLLIVMSYNIRSRTLQVKTQIIILLKWKANLSFQKKYIIVQSTSSTLRFISYKEVKLTIQGGD